MDKIKTIYVVMCTNCKYAVRTKDGELNPNDIVCSMWCTDGLEAGDYCSRGEEGVYVPDDNCIQDQEELKWKEILYDAVKELEYYETHGDLLDRHIWKYKNEALALIGEEGEQNG